MKYILTILTIAVFGLFGEVKATGFDLFEPDRGKAPPPKVAPTSPSSNSKSSLEKPLTNPFLTARFIPSPRPRKPKKFRPQKDFSLVGTSKIGDKHAVVLKGPDNKEFIQRFEDNAPTYIKGYDQYILVSVKPREIQIEYPEDSPCRKDNPKKALTCSVDKKMATLKLGRLKALPPPKPVRPKRTAASKKRAAERKKRQKLYKNFKKQVIKDKDVPPGMRVVRTPFGDRLVPKK